MTHWRTCFGRLVLVLAALAPVVVRAAEPRTAEQRIQVNDQVALSPGYAIGNVAIAAPKVADYKVMPGRREILIFGRGQGTTRLTIWDQKRVKRDELLIHVIAPLAARIERDLRDTLAEFPTIQVMTLGDVLTLTGTASKADQAFVRRVAAIARAQDLVRYFEPTVTVAPVLASVPQLPVAAPSVAPEPPMMRLDLTFLEASSRFRTGSYATGVEPTGRVLLRCFVMVPSGIGGRTVFIGGRIDATAALPPSATDGQACPAPLEAGPRPTDSGIRLVLDAGAPTRTTIPLRILVETNLPVGGHSVEPGVWRRARFQWSVSAGEPIAIAGGDLLAFPGGLVNDPSALQRIQQTSSVVAGLPAARLVPGFEYGPVLGRVFGSKAFQKKSTQLLLLVVPQHGATSVAHTSR